MLCQERVERRN